LQNRVVPIVASLSLIVSTYKSIYLCVLCSKVILTDFDEIPDACSSCF